MAEGTPTTEDMKFAYRDRRDFVAQLSGDEWPGDEAVDAEFDKWLAEHDREVAAFALEAVAAEPWVGEMEPFYVKGEGRVTAFYLLNERAAAIRESDAVRQWGSDA